MKKKHYSENKSLFLFPFAILFLLVIGIFISIVQVQERQNTQSNAAVSPTPIATIQNCTVTGDQMTIGTQEQKLLDQINIYRAQNGLPALSWSQALKRASAWMSKDMLAHHSLGHTDSLGRDIATRLMNCGYPTPAFLGEIVDSGGADSMALFDAWQHSPPQSKDLLNGNFKEAGISFISAASQSYWTLDLGGVMPTATPTITPTPKQTTPPVHVTVTVTPALTPHLTPTGSVHVTGSPTSGVITVVPTAIVTGGPTSHPITGVTPTSIIHLSPTTTSFPTKPFTPTNLPTPTTSPDYIPNPNDVQVFVSIKLAGIGKDGNPAPRHSSRRIQVGVYDMKNQNVKTGTGFVTFDHDDLFRGVVHLGPINNDIYYVKIVSDGTLQRVVMPEFQQLLNNRLNILPTVTLLQGDLDFNNVIDIADYNLALACFRNSQCDQNGGTKGGITPTPAVLADRKVLDLNDNGVIDLFDYNLLLQNYWKANGD